MDYTVEVLRKCKEYGFRVRADLLGDHLQTDWLTIKLPHRAIRSLWTPTRMSCVLGVSSCSARPFQYLTLTHSRAFVCGSGRASRVARVRRTGRCQHAASTLATSLSPPAPLSTRSTPHRTHPIRRPSLLWYGCLQFGHVLSARGADASLSSRVTDLGHKLRPPRLTDNLHPLLWRPGLCAKVHHRRHQHPGLAPTALQCSDDAAR